MNDRWTAQRDRLLADLRDRPLVMGIVNVTPDSFADGGVADTVETALVRARLHQAGGCDILDVGGESTRPGAEVVAQDDELRRVIPVIEAMTRSVPLPISVDTYKAEVARQAIGAGAVMVNDVWGLQKDPDMAAVVAEAGAALVVMHNRDAVDPALDIMADIRRFLDRSLAIADAAGIPRDRILVDPGVGFGKTPAQSMACVNRLDELRGWYGLPVLLGLSRKRFIGHVLDREVEGRLSGTLAANVIGLQRGARVLRVHDVAEHVDAVKLHQAITAEK